MQQSIAPATILCGLSQPKVDGNFVWFSYNQVGKGNAKAVEAGEQVFCTTVRRYSFVQQLISRLNPSDCLHSNEIGAVNLAEER